MYWEYSNRNSETDLKSVLTKAPLISITKSKSGQANTVRSLLKRKQIYGATGHSNAYCKEACGNSVDNLIYMVENKWNFSGLEYLFFKSRLHNRKF